MSLTPGTRLGPYEVIAPIGAGGMGEVYRATDPRLGREVAIKVLPPGFAQDAERLARFEREARAVAGLSHPNILSIFDFGTADGITYAVTELLEGETLRARMGQGGQAVRDLRGDVHRAPNRHGHFCDGGKLYVRYLDSPVATKITSTAAGVQTVVEWTTAGKIGLMSVAGKSR